MPRLADSLARRADALKLEREQLATRLAVIDEQLAVIDAAAKFLTPDAEALADKLLLSFTFGDRTP